MRSGRRFLAATLFALAAPVNSALAFDFSPFVSTAFTFGGDSLGESVTFDEQLQSTSSNEIRAGQFFYLAAGATIPVPNFEGWEAQLSAGYWFDSTTGNGGELRFRRVPIDLLAIRNMSDWWRVVGGLTYHYGGERRCTQDTCTVPNTTYDPALGVVAGVDFLVGGPVTRVYAPDQPRPTKLWFGTRVTLIKYQAQEPGGGEASGDNIGLVIGLNF